MHPHTRTHSVDAACGLHGLDWSIMQPADCDRQGLHTMAARITIVAAVAAAAVDAFTPSQDPNMNGDYLCVVPRHVCSCRIHVMQLCVCMHATRSRCSYAAHARIQSMFGQHSLTSNPHHQLMCVAHVAHYSLKRSLTLVHSNQQLLEDARGTRRQDVVHELQGLSRRRRVL